MAARPKFADAVIIATQDRQHCAPALAFARRGYDILLEKPMAPTEAECRKIVRAARRARRGDGARAVFAVCHVMRYTRYTRALKALLAEGAIGDIVSIEHLEPVGHWHMAHSFVRGNWRNSRESSFMLLAKSCHDIDWLRHVMGVPCTRVSSFGSLRLFRKSERPRGAGKRCLSCRIERKCPYSAKQLYLGMIRKGRKWWPVDVLTGDLTVAGVTKALREGPYGRCVWACDNDVVDHQVVNLEFAGGRTASFSMMAFTRQRDRDTRIFGTKGELTGDGRFISIFDFLTGRTRRIDTETSAAGILGGHGGGDLGLMESFVRAVATRDRSAILSGPDETLESHLMVFAAERSRLRGTVERVRA
jgi:predicted dehydrogenase